MKSDIVLVLLQRTSAVVTTIGSLTLWALARRKPCRCNGSGTTCAGFSQESWCSTLSVVWARMGYRTLVHLANSILFAGSAVRRSRG